MYKAKELGRNNYQVYSPNMGKHNLDKIKLEHDLGDALTKNQFQLYYQPQIDLVTGDVVGLEALIRWNHPDRGMVSPGDFIPLLENSGLILPVGEWVIREACRQNIKWLNAGLVNMRIAVNLSAMQFRQRDLASIISGILSETGLEAKYLELEITEGLLVEDVESTFNTLNALHAQGLHLSIDDFGTGYSSMNYLQRFPLKTLKIDQSFVHEITSNNDDAVITTAMIELAHRLGLSVIAEGVEDEKQLAFLRAHNCDEVQGYYFCRPMPADKITEWLYSFNRPADSIENA
jgi:EAL domain-containing protein (putative c-di-GMP-specific phosphodiesterase class I)